MKNTKQTAQSLTPAEVSKKLLAIEKQKLDLDAQVKQLQETQLSYQVFGVDKLQYLLEFTLSAGLTVRTQKPYTSVYVTISEIAPKGILWCVNGCRLTEKQNYGCSWRHKTGYRIFHDLKIERGVGTHENQYISRNHDQCNITLRCALTKAQFEVCKKIILTTDYETDNTAEELFNAFTKANITLQMVEPHEVFSSLAPITTAQQNDIQKFLTWCNQPTVTEND